MSLDVVFEPTIETQIVSVKQIFKDDTTFDGATNSFSQYPKIDLVSYANPIDQYEFVPKKYTDDTFLKSTDAANTYLTQSTAASTYLTPATAASTYLTPATAASTYLTPATAASTYLTPETAASTYLTPATAASTYLTQEDATTALATKTTESYVNSQINNLIAGAPGTMDTLFEIGNILSSNVNDIGTLTTSIAGKVSKTANETVSGILTFSQPPVLSGASIASGTISDASLASTFLKTSDASSTYLTQSNATTALNLKANLAGPTFTGTVTIPTLITNTNFLTESIISTTHSSHIYTLDYSQGNTFFSSSNPTQNFTVNITNIPTTSTKQYTINLLINTGVFYCNTVSATDTSSTSIVSSSTPKYNWTVIPTVTPGAVVSIHSFTVLSCFSTKYVLYNVSAF